MNGTKPDKRELGSIKPAPHFRVFARFDSSIQEVLTLPFLTVDDGDAWQGPVVFLDGSLGLVLNTSLDYVEGCVQYGGKGTTNGTCNEVTSQISIGSLEKYRDREGRRQLQLGLNESWLCCSCDILFLIPVLLGSHS